MQGLCRSFLSVIVEAERSAARSAARYGFRWGGRSWCGFRLDGLGFLRFCRRLRRLIGLYHQINAVFGRFIVTATSFDRSVANLLIAHVGDVAFQERAFLDRQIFMQDVAHDMRSLRQIDERRLDLAIDVTMHAHRFGTDFALDGGAFADQQDLGTNVAGNLAIDLDFTATGEIADDLQIRADD